jgi:hypothetical protein
MSRDLTWCGKAIFWPIDGGERNEKYFLLFDHSGPFAGTKR